ncbi:MAG TPA: NAD(P)-dependent oxidoreductase [Defluviitaleaceae bacterium]|nr:NAD(P)-dependent oxidoreductase [Defluviitaleaceae bacterium]
MNFNNKKILITGGSGFIGTNYIEYLLKSGQVEFINLDIKPPRNPAHKSFWQKCDLLDIGNLKKIVKDFSPTYIVHLAANTSTSEQKLSAFAVNTKGTENLILALKEVPSVERVIFTSTQLVSEVGRIPKYDTDYKPSTVYGLSKVKMEQIIRTQKDLPYIWTIIRPISIWGPWFDEPYKSMFKSIKKGWYFHIGNGHYLRSLGYVENTVYQINQLLLAPAEKVDRKTFYLADDPPTDLYNFANEIQIAWKARKIWHIPLGIANLAAEIGDILKNFGWKKVPITSFRLNNILTEYVFDLKPILEIAKTPLYNYKEGIKRTIQWMQQRKIC